jgi:hypothetical protein
MKQMLNLKMQWQKLGTVFQPYFFTLEQFTVALLTIFSSTYTSDCLFCITNYVKSDFRNRFIDDSTVYQVNLSMINY